MGFRPVGNDSPSLKLQSFGPDAKSWRWTSLICDTRRDIAHSLLVLSEYNEDLIFFSLGRNYNSAQHALTGILCV